MKLTLRVTFLGDEFDLVWSDGDVDGDFLAVALLMTESVERDLDTVTTFYNAASRAFDDVEIIPGETTSSAIDVQSVA
jgi:hypothetical protein